MKPIRARDDKENAMGERRCIVTGEMRPSASLIRFVAGPDGTVVPDIAGNLPGRGLWVSADRAVLDRAAAGNAFSKAAQAPVKVTPDLAARIETLLCERMLADLGLARRAGQLVLGFDNVLKALNAKTPPRALVEARDGALDGRQKLASAAASRSLLTDTVDCLSGAELSLALGRENVIHAAISPGALADRLIADCARLRGVRASPMDEAAGPSPAR